MHGRRKKELLKSRVSVLPVFKFAKIVFADVFGIVKSEWIEESEGGDRESVLCECVEQIEFVSSS